MAETVSRQERLKSLGEKLKAAREGRGFTIDQAYLKTRIHAKVLAALEEGRGDEVLSPTYVKGFLRKYAALVGLPGDELVREYCAAQSASSHQPAAAPPQVAKSLAPTPSASRRRFIIPVLVVAAALLVYFVSSCRPKGAVQGRPLRTPARSAPTKAATVPQKRGKASVPAQAQKPVVRAARAPSPDAVPPAKEAPTPSVSIPAHEPIILTIRVKRPVFVQVSRDGAVRFGHVLKDGVVETIKANERINVRIANSESLELSVNGKPLVLPKKGEIRDLEITRRGVRVQ